MRTAAYVSLASLLAGLWACTSTPAPHYLFSAEQLAWQPYQKGQILRFGSSRSATVRTYVVESFYDQEYSPNSGPNLTPFPSAKSPYYQEQDVYVQRTDTADLSTFAIADMRFDYWYNFLPQAGSASKPSVVSRVSWPYFPTATLPIDDLNSGNVPDTAVFEWLKVYASLRLGATTYGPVVRVKPPSSLVRSVTTVYYAKGSSVVAFEDQRTGLWYRLP